MLRSRLCDYTDAYLLIIYITDWINEINNTQISNAKYIYILPGGPKKNAPKIN